MNGNALVRFGFSHGDLGEDCAASEWVVRREYNKPGDSSNSYGYGGSFFFRFFFFWSGSFGFWSCDGASASSTKQEIRRPFFTCPLMGWASVHFSPSSSGPNVKQNISFSKLIRLIFRTK